MTRYLLALLILFSSSLCAAESDNNQAPSTKTARVYLMALEPIKVSERQGDELYMNITVYHSQNKPENYQLPQHPLHWQSKYLNKVKNIKLWEDQLTDGQAATIVFSLVEQDIPPWNIDDLLGGTRLKLRNNEGQLELKWRKAHQTGTPQLIIGKIGKTEIFNFKTEDSEYNVSLVLETEG